MHYALPTTQMSIKSGGPNFSVETHVRNVKGKPRKEGTKKNTKVNKT